MKHNFNVRLYMTLLRDIENMKIERARLQTEKAKLVLEVAERDSLSNKSQKLIHDINKLNSTIARLQQRARLIRDIESK